jgi:predicted kinase
MKGHFAIMLRGALTAGGASSFATAQAQPVHTIILRDFRQIADGSAVNEALNALFNAAQS